MTLSCFDRPAPTLTGDEKYLRAWTEALTMFGCYRPADPRARNLTRSTRRRLAKPPRTRLMRPKEERR